jgi:glycine/D-amino acid oxidase-like deaminating enzyme
MRDQAKVVIIGAGIAGTSVAYHLSQLGWKDIVVAPVRDRRLDLPCTRPCVPG